jgi:hypothetical protein
MAETSTTATNQNGTFSESLPLQGRIEYQVKNGVTYGIYIKNTYIKDGKVSHDKQYIGKVIDKDKGIFFSNNRGGYFLFTIENGFDKLANNIPTEIFNIPSNIVLHFGDIWMINSIYQETGLDKIINDIIPDHSDTLKTLVAYRLIKHNDSYSHAYEWYRKSYANILFPQARVESPRISEFHEILGDESINRSFFSSYLQLLSKGAAPNDNNTNKSFPILIDSTGLENSIKSHLTATNNHNGEIHNEIRLIYVIDKISKLPLFFRYVAGNIVDNTTLINTINILKSYNVDIQLVIMDAGYFSFNNLEQLLENDIHFLIRMTKNRKEYKRLMAEHGANLIDAKYAITYGNRALCGKKVEINLFNRKLFAYIMLDFQHYMDEATKAIHSHGNDPDNIDKLNDSFMSAGKFILLSSFDHEITDILPLYYHRQTIEQVFDIGKTYCGLLPLRGHFEKTLRGILLNSFISTFIYSFISNKLSDSIYSAHSALIYMNNLMIKIYNSITLVEEITKQQSDIFNLLKLDNPFIVESNNPLHKPPILSSIKNKKRGRPKGSLNKQTQKKQNLDDFDSPIKIKNNRGRPKGSKNKPKHGLGLESSRTPKRRGRPKGSKNKPKQS